MAGPWRLSRPCTRPSSESATVGCQIPFGPGQAAADRPGDATARLAKSLAAQEDAKAIAEAMADQMTTAPPVEALVAAYKKTKPADRATAAKLEAKAAGLKRGGSGKE